MLSSINLLLCEQISAKIVLICNVGQCTGTDTIGKDKTDSRKKKNYDGDPGIVFKCIIGKTNNLNLCIFFCL